MGDGNARPWLWATVMILVALIPVGAVIINNINGNGVITKDESSDLEPVSLIELVIPSTSNSGVPFTATE